MVNLPADLITQLRFIIAKGERDLGTPNKISPDKQVQCFRECPTDQCIFQISCLTKQFKDAVTRHGAGAGWRRRPRLAHEQRTYGAVAQIPKDGLGPNHSGAANEARLFMGASPLPKAFRHQSYRALLSSLLQHVWISRARNLQDVHLQKTFCYCRWP